MSKFLRLLFSIVLAGLVYWLIGMWALPAIGLPQPFAKLAQVVLIVLVCAIVLDGVLGLTGKNYITFY